LKIPSNPRISSRKQPKQQRSEQLVADILEAAVRVLERDGAHRFTTARVAEKAGVSVGSLYQYFPNKEAILFRLQTDEWARTGNLLQTILADESLSPADRLRSVVRAFFRSECEEAGLRVALGDAAPLYRDAPETQDHRRAGMRQVVRFMQEAVPGISRQQRAVAADIIMMSLESVGKKISEQDRRPAAVDALAAAMGEMFCAYLDRLAAQGGTVARR
jgi:AcrR family transcriptional regulator